MEKKEQQVKDVKERHLTLSQQKRKITLIIGNVDGSVYPSRKKSKHEEKAETKVDPVQVEQYER